MSKIVITCALLITCLVGNTFASSEKVDQIESFKKYMTGYWTAETGKDTLFNWDCKSNGNYLEASAWWTDANGNKFGENKCILAYDKNSDKFIWTRIFKNGAAQISACWFTSPNVMEIIPLVNLYNPADATTRTISTYPSSEMSEQTFIVDGKVTRVYKYTRQKEQTGENLQEMNLNQFELIDQYNGYWTGEIGKDTIEIWDGKRTANGIEANVRTMYKDKTLTQGRTTLVYDRSIDKFIGTDMYEGQPPTVFTLNFKTEHSGEIVMIKDISNPDKATFKILFDFKTPREYTQTMVRNNKSVKVNAYYLQSGK